MAKANEKELYWVRIGHLFDYDGLARQHGLPKGELPRGAIIGELRGCLNDALMVEDGHLEKVPADAHPVQCGICELWFLTDGMRTAHGNRDHRPRRTPDLAVAAASGHDPMGRYDPALIDVTGDAEEADRESLIHWDQKG